MNRISNLLLEYKKQFDDLTSNCFSFFCNCADILFNSNNNILRTSRRCSRWHLIHWSRRHSWFLPEKSRKRRWRLTISCLSLMLDSLLLARFFLHPRIMDRKPRLHLRPPQRNIRRCRTHEGDRRSRCSLLGPPPIW